MRRYLRLLGVQLRASTLLALSSTGSSSWGRPSWPCFWSAWALIPLLVVYGTATAVAGWSFEEALVVMGWFTLMKGVLEGAINPSLASVVEHIRKGTLDFVLLKPADAQFLVSTARFAPWHVVDVGLGLALFGVAFHRLGRWPEPAHVLAALVLLACAAGPSTGCGSWWFRRPSSW